MGVKLLIVQMMMMLVMLVFIQGAFVQNTNHWSVAKPGCQDRCGSLVVPYPFGIGPNCSAYETFEIHCDNSFNPPKAFSSRLHYFNYTKYLEVLNISLEAGTIHISYPISTDCTNTTSFTPTVIVRSPFTFSNTENRFTAMGCHNLALLRSFKLNETIGVGGCVTRCDPSLKKDNTCFGINCCQTQFPPSLQAVRARSLSLSTVGLGYDNSPRCSGGPRYAFIVDRSWFGNLKDIDIVKDREAVPAVVDWRAFGACQSFDGENRSSTLCGINTLCTNQGLCSCKEGYEGNPYLPEGCQDMSGKGRRPPFLQSKDTQTANPVATPPPKNNELLPPPPPKSNIGIAPQPSQANPEQHVSKRHKKSGPLPQVAKPADPMPVHHLYAKHGYTHATEEECTEWVGAELIENSESVSKCLAEGFIRQASHLRELREVVSANERLEKEVKSLKIKAEEEKKLLMENYKRVLQTETATLRSELKKVNDEKAALHKSLIEAEQHEEEQKKKYEEEQNKLKAKLAAAQSDREAVEEAAQTEFMKGFIRKVPDFDWSQLGPGNAEFAADLRKEIEEEDAKESARLASEAAKANVANQEKPIETSNQNKPTEPAA